MRHTPHRAGIFIGKAVLHFAGLMKLATFACVRKGFLTWVCPALDMDNLGNYGNYCFYYNRDCRLMFSL